MKSFGRVATAFWTRGSGKKLRGDGLAQAIGLYLTTAPTASAIGVYYLPLATISNDTGHSIDTVREVLKRLHAVEFAHYDEEHEVVWIPNLALFDVGPSLKDGDRRRSKIIADVRALGDHAFTRAFWHMYSEIYSLGDYPFTGKISKQDGAYGIETGASETRNKCQMDLVRLRLSDLSSSGEGVGGGPEPPPPDASGVQVRPMSNLNDDGLCGQSEHTWVESVKATGNGCPKLKPFEREDLIELINEFSDGRRLEPLQQWIRETVAEFVSSTDPKYYQRVPGKCSGWLRDGKPHKDARRSGSTRRIDLGHAHQIEKEKFVNDWPVGPNEVAR